MIGKSIAHYQITALLGQGGMGEVYRAQDTKLRREVAIKVLPPEFTRDADRLARFEREAQLLAQLHHPRIASIFGLEEQDGVRALVMELVEGPTLDQRLSAGPLSLQESLSIARQVAEALEAAHAKGIIHRDLKPQNIKASEEGQVKVLDFGLAKAMDPNADDQDSSLTRLSDSPTLSPAATAHGVILGTASYMSPEQARGSRVDKRSDIWAFGVVLYEMLAGSELFEGPTVSDRIAGVLKSQIRLDALDPATPPAIRRLLRRCLERDPNKRIHDIADARIVLDEVLEGRAEEVVAPIAVARPRRWLRALPWALVLFLGVTLLLRLNASGPAPAEAIATRAVELSLPTGALLFDDAPPTFSPDGQYIVFGAADATRGTQLLLRRLDRFEALPLAGTENASHPFWSPDSKSIGFFRTTDGTMNRYDLATAVVRVVLHGGSGSGRGGAWGTDGTILFSRSANAPIERVSSDGGTPQVITDLDPEILDGSHRFPIWLADGKHFLFTMWSNHLETANRVGGIYLASVDEGILHRVAPDVSQAVLVGDDRLLVRRDHDLVALRFDPRSYELQGGGELLAEDPLFAPHSGALGATASNRGDVAFALASGEGNGQLVWLDREGKPSGMIGNERLAIHRVAPAPDGRHFAVQVHTSTGSNIWVGDERRQVLDRLTPVGLDSQYPVWSPGSDRIVYASGHTGAQSIYIQPADGSRPAELLFSEADRDFRPSDWSSDGRYLLLMTELKISSRSDLWLYDFQTQEARLLLSENSASIRDGKFSRDMKWIAYSSDESGNPEIFVRPFPSLAGKWKLSQGGGAEPHWKDDGSELLFVSIANHSSQSVSIRADGEKLEAGIPQEVFTPRSPLMAMVPSPDHSRMLAGVVPGDVRSEPIRMLVGWGAAR